MTGGGTGGHLSIIEALKNELKEENLFYIGSTKGQDKLWFFKDENFCKSYFLDTRGVVNQRFLGKIISIYKLIKSIFISISILRKNKINIIFSVGGYSSAPASFAGIILRIPLIIHEQNFCLGTLNKVLKPFSNKFISSYNSTPYKTSYPVKLDFFKSARNRKSIKRIIFLGGSQGSSKINSLALSLAKELKNLDIEIIHQAGDKNIKEIKEKYKLLGVKVEVFGFTKNLSYFMKISDLAISRSGASILWELTANRLPAIFIPYPFSAKDHQYFNAKFLVEKNLAWLFREKDINKDKILEIIKENKIEDKSIKLGKIINENGALEISKLIKK